MDNFLERLNRLISDISNGNVTDFAKKTDIKQATLFNYTKGRMPNAESLYNICNNLGVSIDWLLTGKGNPYLSTSGNGATKNKETTTSSKSSSKISKNTLVEIIDLFKDKNYAKELNACLVELERIKPDAYKEVGSFIKGVLEGVRIMSPKVQRYLGYDRRNDNRRKQNISGDHSGENDRRSGMGRREEDQREADQAVNG